jgi:hypothetical protein
MTVHSLTALQRDVLQRLHAAGFPAIADCALSCWSVGRRCLQPLALRDPKLLADYEAANGGVAPRA